MYQGKHTSAESRRAPRKNRRLRWNRQFVLLVSIIALLVGIVGSSLAYLVTKTDPVQNTFQPSKVTCEIKEEFSQGGSEKKNVQVKNTGDTDAYIRAALVFTWVDSQGNIAPVAVKESDYVLVLGTGWSAKQANGFYYYKTSVAPGEKTNNLVDSITRVKDAAPEGYTLCVDVIADAVQAKGEASNGNKAVVEAWGVDPTTLQ